MNEQLNPGFKGRPLSQSPVPRAGKVRGFLAGTWIPGSLCSVGELQEIQPTAVPPLGAATLSPPPWGLSAPFRSIISSSAGHTVANGHGKFDTTAREQEGPTLQGPTQQDQEALQCSTALCPSLCTLSEAGFKITSSTVR